LAHILNVPQKQAYRVNRKKVYRNVTTSPVWRTNDLTRRVGIVAYISEPVTVAQMSGLLDPEVVLWNAIPLSFVADWFIPVGNWLQARAFSSKLVGTFVRSDKQELVRSGPLYQFPNGTGWVITGGATVRFRNGTFDRTITNSLTVKRPVYQGLGALTNWKRATTAVALITSYIT
jgi:hypothetical protein